VGWVTLPFCERAISFPRNRYILHSERGLAFPLIAVTLGEKLRKKRAELKLRQIELARLLGVSMVSISRWERDIGVIRASHRTDILRFLD
jgi:DNA-binding XRE family transcriptional regulator